MNRHAVTLYSENAPMDLDVDHIVKTIKLYNHNHLHLCGHIRHSANYSDKSFGDLTNTIRQKAGLPQLTFVND